MENSKQPINGIPNSNYGEHGLTKREYFAGLAMRGLLSNLSSDRAIEAICNTTTEKGVKHTTAISVMALEIADELLKQLDK